MVRRFLWMLAIGGVVLPTAWQLLHPVPRPAAMGYEWRRTSGGWEQRPRWRSPAVSTQPVVHPLTLGGLQLAVALVALSAAPRESTAREPASGVGTS